MRKALVLTLCLAILSAAGIGLVHGLFSEKHDSVVITENVLYGDRSEADGVAVELNTHYNYHLFWDTEYVVGDVPKTKTAYEFSAREQYSHSPWEYNGIHVTSNFEFGMDVEKKNPQGLEKAYIELFNRCEPGQELETTIFLADYCDYYPLQIQIDLENCNLHFVSNVYDGDDVDLGPQILHYDGRNTGYYEVFADYFKIPVLPEETIQIHVRKGDEGGIRSSGGGWGSGDSDRYNLYSIGAVGKDSCFFVFDAHSYEGKVMDMSLLPDGFGIFSVPHFINEEGTTDIDPYSLEMVYELDPESWVSNFFLSHDKTELMLFTVEGGLLMMTVIDAETFETLQKVEVCPAESPLDIYNYHIHNDFIVISHGESQLSVMALGSSGYEYQYTVKRYVEADDTVYPADYLKISAAMDFDHSTGKLLIADAMENQDGGWNMTADFYISVYDKNGMLYHGAYTSSLTTDGRSDDYDYFVRNIDDDYITAHWG